MSINRNFFLRVLLGLAVSGTAMAGEPTAFDLIKAGDQYIGVQSKDRVVGIHSEKSIATLVPNIWYVDYYDPDATFKAVEVKFGAGVKLDVSHPWRMIEIATDDHKVLDKKKLNVDSDKAIRIACAEPLLKNLTLKATQLQLEHGDVGPQWRVKLWAAKLSHPEEDADIGVIILSADDGSVISTDLHPNSVD